MMIHPREENVRLATHNISVVIEEMFRKHDLTEAETIQVVTQVTSSVLLSIFSAYKDGWSNCYDEGMTDMMDK